MLRYLILKKLDSVERRLGQPVDYLRHIVRTSLRSFFKFLKIMPISEYRRALPPDAWHVARIVATRDADCGTCVQIELNLAKEDRISPEILRAVIDGKPEQLSTELADVYRFTVAIVRASDDADGLRERVRKSYGEAGLIELALAIGSSRFFPIVKRTLGFATACSRVKLSL